MFQDQYKCKTRLYYVLLAFQCVYRCIGERGENGEEEEITCFLHADDFVLYAESEQDLRAMVGCFCRKGGQ